MFCVFGTDKVGRPNIYCKMANFLPDLMSLENCEKFMVALMDYVSVRSAPHIDQLNMIFDFTDFGRANLDMTKGKGLVDVSGKLYTGKIYRFYLLNISWGASLVYNIFKPIIP